MFQSARISWLPHLLHLPRLPHWPRSLCCPSPPQTLRDFCETRKLSGSLRRRIFNFVQVRAVNTVWAVNTVREYRTGCVYRAGRDYRAGREYRAGRDYRR